MPPGPTPQKKRILLEAVLVAVVGFLFALAANQVSPRGLTLTRDIFGLGQITNAPQIPPPTNHVAGTNAPSLADVLKAKGLQLADSNQVFKLYQDPRYAMELVIFIDARDDKDYQGGHIPGAYQLDHYYLQNYLPSLLAVCQTAEQIVCYCNGGDCEDSQFAALDLAEQKIPKEKLFIYGGGMTEWSTNGWPIEIGARKSGVLRQPSTNTTAGAK